MNENRNEAFDERQKERRDRVGRQMFFVVTVVIVFLGLMYQGEVFAFSFHRWAMITVGSAMIFYCILMFILGAYVPARWNTRRGQIIFLLLIAAGIAVTWVTVFIFEVPVLVVFSVCIAVAVIELVVQQIIKMKKKR